MSEKIQRPNAASQGAPEKPVSSLPCEDVRDLTPSEIESLRREFAASAAWMDEMIRTGEINRL